MRKFISLFFILVTVISLFPITVYGDGMAFTGDKGITRLWNEEYQFCSISYKDGYQNMILLIKPEETNVKSGVWLFPVPARPEDVKLNVVKRFQELSGVKIQETCNIHLSEAFYFMRLSQLYPFMYNFILPATTCPNKSEYEFERIGSINKMGVSTEVISAQNIVDLSNGLERKGIKIDSLYLSKIESYLGKNYSFVVTWIDNENIFSNKKSRISDDYGRPIIDDLIGVNIVLPSKKIFYPLKPVSVYGDRSIPAVIYIEGFVTPNIFKDISSFTKVNYLTDETDENNNYFSTSTNNKINYTKIEINSSSKFFTDDLWIEENIPANVRIYDFINNSIGLIGFIILFLMISGASGYISGLISFKKCSIRKHELILLGLCNIFSILGIIAAVYKLKINEPNEKAIKSIRKSVCLNILYSSALFLLLCLCFKLKFITMFLYLLFLVPLLFIYQVHSLSCEEVDRDIKIINVKKRKILMLFNVLPLIYLIATIDLNNTRQLFVKYFNDEWFIYIYMLIIYLLNLLTILIIPIIEKFFKVRFIGQKAYRKEYRMGEKKVFVILFSLIFIMFTVLVQTLVCPVLY